MRTCLVIEQKYQILVSNATSNVDWPGLLAFDRSVPFVRLDQIPKFRGIVLVLVVVFVLDRLGFCGEKEIPLPRPDFV